MAPLLGEYVIAVAIVARERSGSVRRHGKSPDLVSFFLNE
jgi:hypothetical protein